MINKKNLDIEHKVKEIVTAFNTKNIRLRVSKLARKNSLVGHQTVVTTRLAEILKQECGNQTSQEFYARSLVGFYDYAVTHYYFKDLNKSMLDAFLENKRIYFESYVEA